MTDISRSVQQTLEFEKSRLFEQYENWFKSEDQFPVDIQKLDIYVQKKHCVKALKKQFVENEDYIIKRNVKNTNTPSFEKRGGSNYHEICVTIRCLKELLILQRSVRGKQYRRYYILFEELMHAKWKDNRVHLERIITNYKRYDKHVDQLRITEAEQKDELYYQRILDALYPDQLAKPCMHGVMDLHLNQRIVEIKHWEKYKHCLGQLLAYSDDRKTLTAVFFGPLPDCNTQNNIRELLSRYHIEVWYFDNEDKCIREQVL